MTDSNPSFLGRISLAVGTFFRILGDGEFAAGVLRLRDGGTAAAPRPPRHPRPRRRPLPQPAPVAEGSQPRRRAATARPAATRRALHRFRRRRHQELSATPTSAPPRASCTTVAARRCASTSRSVRCATKPKAAASRCPKVSTQASIRLTGNVVGKAPFSGSISHRGWRVDEVRLPKLADSHNAKVIAPAEVEL